MYCISAADNGLVVLTKPSANLALLRAGKQASYAELSTDPTGLSLPILIWNLQHDWDSSFILGREPLPPAVFSQGRAAA